MLMLRSGTRVACNQATCCGTVSNRLGSRQVSARSAGTWLIMARHALLQHASMLYQDRLLDLSELDSTTALLSGEQ